MGRILVEARLWNILDDARVRAKRKHPVSRECLVDTGATESVIPPELTEELHLIERGSLRVRYASGKKARRKLSYGLMVEIEGRVTETRAIVEPGVKRPLIGQTVLESLDLVADCKNGRLISNPEHDESPMMEIYASTRA